MKVLRFTPIIFSFILLASHISRADLNFIAIPVLLIPFLLFIKKAGVARIIQIILLLGAAEWVRVLFEYVDIRSGSGQDSTRLVMIISVLAIITLLSAFIFQTKPMKRIYKLK